MAAKFAVAGDFDGDGRDELAVAKDAAGDRGQRSAGSMRLRPGRPPLVPPEPRVRPAEQCRLSAWRRAIAAKFAVAGDFDGDGRDEIAIAQDVGGSRGNDFWVMDYDPATGRWRTWTRLPAAPATNGDVDCSPLPVAAKFAVVGDFDGDGRDELAVAPGRRRDPWERLLGDGLRPGRPPVVAPGPGPASNGDRGDIDAALPVGGSSRSPGTSTATAGTSWRSPRTSPERRGTTSG